MGHPAATLDKPTRAATQPIQFPVVRSRERLRFAEFDFDPRPDGNCVASIVLEWRDDVRFCGQSEGTQTPQGVLRCGAEAALEAVEKAARGACRFSLIGVKAIRAFDVSVIVVAVRGRTDDGAHRLIGSYLADGNKPAHGAAMSVLDATNRLLAKYLKND